MLNGRQDIVQAELAVQLVPSIQEGLKYVVFFKKIEFDKLLVAIANSTTILYRSAGFRDVLSSNKEENRFKELLS